MPNADDKNIDKLTIEIESQASKSSDGLKDLSATIDSLRKNVAESAPELAAFSANLQRLSNETSAFNARASQTSGYKSSIADVKNLTSEMNKMAQAERTAADIEMERMQNEMRLNEQLAKPVASKKTNQADPAQMAAEMAKAQREAIPLIESIERLDALYKQIDERVHSGVLSDTKFSDDMGWTRGKTLNISEEMLKEADALGVARQEIFDYANSLYSIYSSEEMAEQGARSFANSVKDQNASLSAMVTECNTAEKAATDWIEAYNEASDAVERFGKKAEIVDFNEQTFAAGDSGIAQLNAIRDEMLARQQNTETVKAEMKAVQDLNAAKSAKVSVAQGYSGFTAVRDVESLAINQQRESAKAQDDITAAVKRTNDEINRTPGATRRAHKATQNWLTKLWQVTKRIIISRLIRTLVNDALNGAKEGLQNIVHFSDEANKAMSSLSTNTQYLKNSFAALATPILTLLMPAFNWLTDSLVDISNHIAEFFAALNGSDTYTRALKATVNYVDTLGDSTEKAAKAQRQLIGGFDELNVFGNSKGNSSASKGAEDFTKMFETAQVTAKASLGAFGESLAKRLNEIPWGDLGYTLGTKLSGMLNGAIEQFNAFVSTFDFGSIGNFVGNFINSIEWGDFIKNLAESLLGLFTGAIDLATGLLETVKWDKVTKKLLEGIKGAVSALWENKEKIAQSIARFLGDALAAVGKISVTVVTELGNWIVDNINATIEYFKDDIEECGGDVGRGILKGINDATDNLGGWLDKNFFTPLVGSFKEQAGISGDTSKLTQSLGKATGRGLVIGLGFELGLIPGLVASTIFLISDIMDGSALENLKNVGYAIGNAIKTGFFEVLDMIIETANSVLYYINPDWTITKPQFLQDYLYERDHPTTAQGYHTRPRTASGIGKSVKRNSTSQSADMYYDYVANAASAQANGNGTIGEVTDAWDSYVEKIVTAIEENRTEVNVGDEEIARSAARGGKQVRKQTGENIFA